MHLAHGLTGQDVDMNFGPALRRYRSAAGLTQTQLASAAGLDQTAISRWERETGLAPRLDEVAAVERALELERGELLLAAGLVEPEGVERAILADPGLDPLRKSLLVETYRGFLRTTKELGKKLGTVK